MRAHLSRINPATPPARPKVSWDWPARSKVWAATSRPPPLRPSRPSTGNSPLRSPRRRRRRARTSIRCPTRPCSPPGALSLYESARQSYNTTIDGLNREWSDSSSNAYVPGGATPEQAQAVQDSIDAKRADLRRRQQDLRRQLAELQLRVAKTRALVNKVEQARQEGDAFLAQYMTDRRTTSSIIQEELVSAAKEAGIKAN